MRKPKKQKKRLNDLSHSLTPFEPNHTLIAVIDNASSYCAPFYVARIAGFFWADSILADGAPRGALAYLPSFEGTVPDHSQYGHLALPSAGAASSKVNSPRSAGSPLR